MTQSVFVIRNQHQQYLQKKMTWHSGKDNASLYNTDHHDEALNTLLELNSKDIELRGEILSVDRDEKKNPLVEIDDNAIALDESAKKAFDVEASE